MCYTCAFRLFLYLHRNTAHIVACISKLFVWVGGLDDDDFVICYTEKKNDDFFFLFNSHLQNSLTLAWSCMRENCKQPRQMVMMIKSTKCVKMCLEYLVYVYYTSVSER